jgi:hypothetical protein
VKYYVCSGEFRKIVTANDNRDAIDKAIRFVNGETLGTHFCVDQRGFRDVEVRGDVGTIDTFHSPAFIVTVNSIFPEG